jgi:hypothetical protein
MNRSRWPRTSRLEPGTPPSRRVPIARNAPLRASGAPLAAREPETKPKSAATGRGGMGQRKAGPKGEFSPATKLLVRKRAGRGDEFEALAECCGKHLGRDAGEFQHRAARGSGGCRDAVVNGPANCLLMCHDCHRQAEGRDAHMGMDAAGFWIEHGTTPEFDPRSVSVMLHGAGGGGRPVFLAADGLGPDGTGYLLQAPEARAAA